MALVKSILSGFSPPSPPHHFVRTSLYTSALCFLLTAVPANISFATNNNLDLSDLSLKQLMNLEVSLVGQNLLHSFHEEMEQLSYLSLATEVERST